MEKSFDVRFPLERDYEKLKKLWRTAFDDCEDSLDFFFKNTVSPERVLAVFWGDTPVSALYMLESEIVFRGKTYRSYYIYAVCTHPDFLKLRRKGVLIIFSSCPKKNICLRCIKSRGLKRGLRTPERLCTGAILKRGKKK